MTQSSYKSDQLRAGDPAGNSDGTGGASDRPLSDLRVLDTGQQLAGPCYGRLMVNFRTGDMDLTDRYTTSKTQTGSQ